MYVQIRKEASRVFLHSRIRIQNKLDPGFPQRLLPLVHPAGSSGGGVKSDLHTRSLGKSSHGERSPRRPVIECAVVSRMEGFHALLGWLEAWPCGRALIITIYGHCYYIWTRGGLAGALLDPTQSHSSYQTRGDGAKTAPLRAWRRGTPTSSVDWGVSWR